MMLGEIVRIDFVLLFNRRIFFSAKERLHLTGGTPSFSPARLHRASFSVMRAISFR